jgi:hypothetical protein
MTSRSETHGARVLLLAAVLGLTGCAQPRAQITLDQPHAPPSQRRVELASDWAFTATQDARQLFLIDFALPGAADGPRDFRVFLIMPGDSEKAEIAAAPHASATGFFIQKVGRLSGKTTFTAGTVAIERPLLQPGVRELNIDARCADGTRVVGRALLRESTDELRLFLLMHAADVAALDSAQQPPTSLAGDTTPQRADLSGGGAEEQPATDSRSTPIESDPPKSASTGTE